MIEAASAPTERGALVDWVAEQIHAAILEGELPVGSWLRQDELAERLQVSRTPVREALRVLDASDVIEVIPRRGAIVRGPTSREIRDAYQVRGTLEGLAAEVAARRISDRDLAALRRAEELFASATRKLMEPERTDPQRAAWAEDWVRANDAFHGAVIEASGNTLLAQTIAALHRRFPRNVTWIALEGRPHLLRDNVAQHEQVRAALEAGDGATARSVLRHHVEQAGELVARWFEQQMEEPDR